MYGIANFDQGSFGTGAVWKEPFLFKVPDGIADEDAAPLMCGGATVFNALRKYDAQPTERVGVMGVGGLGHLAIQFAAKMGCEVVVFSGTDSKRQEALGLGATEFYAMKGVTKLDIGRPLNRLLVTTSVMPGEFCWLLLLLCCCCCCCYWCPAPTFCWLLLGAFALSEAFPQCLPRSHFCSLTWKCR